MAIRFTPSALKASVAAPVGSTTGMPGRAAWMDRSTVSTPIVAAADVQE